MSPMPETPHAPAMPASDAPPSFVRRFLWPDWQHRQRMLYREAWFVAAAAYPLLAFAYLWPEDWRNASAGYVLGAWAAFGVRVLQFHLGLLLAVILGIALWRR